VSAAPDPGRLLIAAGLLVSVVVSLALSLLRR
jgi:hypothetical protein